MDQQFVREVSKSYISFFIISLLQITVSCPLLIDPNNGTITCLLGDDGVPSYSDTCSFTCNTGYELTDSNTRTCLSDGSWSGTNDVCRIGELLRMLKHNIVTKYILPQELYVCVCVSGSSKMKILLSSIFTY